MNIYINHNFDSIYNNIYHQNLCATAVNKLSNLLSQHTTNIWAIVLQYSHSIVQHSIILMHKISYTSLKVLKWC